MKYEIKNEVFEIFPDLKIGIVVGKGLTIGKRTPGNDRIIKQNTGILLETTQDKTLQDFPNIKAWRETYRAFNVNPKKKKPTAEAFLRRIVKGDMFPAINSAVDAYLAVELLTMLPIGGYDLRTIEGDIVLKVSPGGEQFIPIGGDDVQETNPGEIIYTDDKRVLTRNWNYKDCDHTKITEDSTDIILASEIALNTINADDLTTTIDKIVEYESLCCGGEYKTYYLDRENPVASL
jgi:DNA/RNA-binding domain of Phe-tRNA-synthetase-like protein